VKTPSDTNTLRTSKLLSSSQYYKSITRPKLASMRYKKGSQITQDSNPKHSIKRTASVSEQYW